MLDCKPDKLAHNAPSQSEPWEARQAIPGFTQADKLSQSSMGKSLDKREATDPRGNEGINPEPREKQKQRGTLGQGTRQEHRTTHAAGS